MHWLGFLVIMGVGVVVVVLLIVWGIPANERRLAARGEMDSAMRAELGLRPDDESASARDSFWGTTMEPGEYPSDDVSEEGEEGLDDGYDRWAAFTDEELAALEGALKAGGARASAGVESLAEEIGTEIAQRSEDA
jgi:hypothetical protein